MNNLLGVVISARGVFVSDVAGAGDVVGSRLLAARFHPEGPFASRPCGGSR